MIATKLYDLMAENRWIKGEGSGVTASGKENSCS